MSTTQGGQGSAVQEGIPAITQGTPLPFSLLVPVAGDDVELAVLATVEALVSDRAARPTILSVFDPSVYAAPPMLGNLLASAGMLLGPAFYEERKALLRQRLEERRGHPTPWPIEIALGGVVGCIRETAERLHPELIVMGLHHHGAIDRALGEDTAHQAMAELQIPVLAIRPTLQGLPKDVIVPVDFSRASVRAARLAAQLMAEGGTLHLVYVSPVPGIGETETTEGLAVILSGGVRAAFAWLAEQVDPPARVHVIKTVLEGKPAEEIITYAERHSPDLIAIGSQAHDRVVRLLAGSLTAAVVHDGRWSALVTPPAGA